MRHNKRFARARVIYCGVWLTLGDWVGHHGARVDAESSHSWPQAPKPRQIIARFLRYSDRERFMNNARKLKGKNFRISADLSKEIVDRRKKARPKFFAAKKAGKSAYFSRAEPNNYLLMADYVLLRVN